jgi:predicted enzyme related to lactoylglutathione lyase
MEITSYSHGEPSWQDQTSPDDAKAAEFYAGLFGWDCPPGDPEFGSYRQCSLNGKLVAGINPQTSPGPTAWTTYINVDKASDVASLVTENGGQIMLGPMEIGHVGTVAVFMDPTGAAFGVWEPGTHKGAELRNEPGAACWHELVTSDVDAASTFYSAVFGWAAQPHGSAESKGYMEFKLGDKTIGGMMSRPPSMPAHVPPHWAVYFAVEDADAAAAKVSELGGKVIVGPTDIEPGRFALVADSLGASFNILQSSR